MRRPSDVLGAERLAEEIRIEQREDPSRRASSVDVPGIRAKETNIIERIRAAGPMLREVQEDGTWKPNPSLKLQLEVHIAVITGSFRRLGALVESHDSTVSKRQRYSPAAHTAAAELFPHFTAARAKIERRLSNNDVDRAIKHRCSVGDTVTAALPLDLHDRAVRMLAVLQDSDFAPRYQARGIELAPVVRPLKLALDKLKQEIAKGPGTGIVTRGENTEDIQQETVFLDIALDRVLEFIADHDESKELAAAIRALIPRKSVKHKKSEAKKDEDDDD